MTCDQNPARARSLSHASRLGRGGLLFAAALLVSAVLACRSAGEFVWVDAYKPSSAAVASGAYVIGAGDSINVKVWNQEAMSAKVRVRDDGMISLPFVHDVEAVGLEPTELAKRIQTKLKDYIVNPEVTVSLEEEAPMEISVLGEVAKPGVLKIERNVLLVKVIASAGGLNDLAHQDGIYVLRYSAGAERKSPMRIRFRYRDLVQAQGQAATFRLRSGDVVVVE